MVDVTRHAVRALAEAESVTVFADNFNRLLGLHRLRGFDVSSLLGVSMPTISAWRTGERIPNVTNAISIGKLFEVSGLDLMSNHFENIEAMFDPERFKTVEAKLR